MIHIPRYTLVHKRSATPMTGAKGDVATQMSELLDESHQTANSVHVGLWDLGAFLGFLPRVIEAMNHVQDRFLFVEVLAAVPGGLISQPQRVEKWAAEHIGPLSEEDRKDLLENIIAEDFFPRAERIRRDTRVHYLVGITPSMVAWKDDKGPHWNYISTCENRLLLVSVHDFPAFARKARRPFEALVAWAVLAQLLVAMHYPKIGFHYEIRGCLFDYHEERWTIGNALKKGRIDPACLEAIPPRDRAAVQALVKVLHHYSSGDPS